MKLIRIPSRINPGKTLEFRISGVSLPCFEINNSVTERSIDLIPSRRDLKRLYERLGTYLRETAPRAKRVHR